MKFGQLHQHIITKICQSFCSSTNLRFIGSKKCKIFFQTIQLMCSLKKPIIRISNIKNSVRFLNKKCNSMLFFEHKKCFSSTVEDYVYSRYCPYFPKIVSLMWPKLLYISLFSKLKSDLAICVSFMVLPYSLEKTPSGKGSVAFSKVY